MRTVYKYPIEIVQGQEIELPSGGKILCVQMQNGAPFIWVDVETRNPNNPRVVEVFGTGHEMDQRFNRKYVGTVQDSQFVWHIYERI